MTVNILKLNNLKPLKNLKTFIGYSPVWIHKDFKILIKKYDKISTRKVKVGPIFTFFKSMKMTKIGKW